MRRITPLIAALAAGLVLMAAESARWHGSSVARASAQSVAPWSWTAPSPAAEPAPPPRAPSSPERPAAAPRTKRPAPSAPSSGGAASGRTLEPAGRSAPAPGGTVVPAPPRPRAEDGSAAIDWLFRD